MGTVTPTAEQQHAIDLFNTGRNVTIRALAGTGKTSTLQLIAQSAPERRGLYLAFNKRIADEAKGKFQGTGVTAQTVHSLAFASHAIKERVNKSGLRTGREKAEHLNIQKHIFPSGSGAAAGALSAVKMVGLVTAAVKAFMKSPDAEITRDHVELPFEIADLREPHRGDLEDKVVRYAQAYWADLTSPEGKIRYEHDVYLKAWALDEPDLSTYDFILFDEAQDADRVITGVLKKQRTQMIVVGDPNQQIYSWRGTENAMDAFDGEPAVLTQSFRFGVEAAEYANRWLELIGATDRLVGYPEINSQVAAPERVTNTPDAILCRTNARAISEIVDAQEVGLKVAIAGERKSTDILNLAQAALDLQTRKWTSHPDLSSFDRWDDVVVYAQSDDGEDLRPLVELVERVGAERVVSAIKGCVPMGRQNIVVSTAHVAKGLEWRYVRIADDFREPKEKRGVMQPILAEEARLIYVAVTRAVKLLDITALTWLDSYLERGGFVQGGPVPNLDATVHVSGDAPRVSEETFTS